MVEFNSQPNRPMLTINTAAISDATRQITLNPLTRTVSIAWWSGSYSTHTGIRRRDMLRLLDRRLSYGQWANRYVLDACA